MRGTHVQHCQEMSIGTLGIPNVPGTVAAIPINPMGCDGITWDVPQSSMSYAAIPGFHPVPVYHGMGDGTQNSVRHPKPSHPVPWYTGWNGHLGLRHRTGDFVGHPVSILTLVHKESPKIPFGQSMAMLENPRSGTYSNR